MSKIRNIAFALGVGLLTATPACHFGEAHSDGYAVGTLINVRDQGLIWDRPMVTLLHVGEMKADPSDDFALDDGLLQTAQSLSTKNERVRVRFVQRYACWSWNFAKCDIITDIQPDVPATPTETGSGAGK